MKRTFPFVTGGLCAGLSSSEDDSDDSSLGSSFFFPFVPSPRWAYTHTHMRKSQRKKRTQDITREEYIPERESLSKRLVQRAFHLVWP